MRLNMKKMICLIIIVFYFQAVQSNSNRKRI